MNIEIIPHINTLARFCGARDVNALTRAELKANFGFERADVMVLFGGSIIEGGDVLAWAMKEGVARKYAIVGGEGHTTGTLRRQFADMFKGWDTKGFCEAEMFDEYIYRAHGLCADMIECRSTNCGNNITFLLEMLAKDGCPQKSVILTQDATMQRRMAACLRKYRPDMTVINFASYSVNAVAENGKIAFDELPLGMWDVEGYVRLLTGEIPRLKDDENGYGPKGRGYIAHEDIPKSVEQAYDTIMKYDAGMGRKANPEYESPDSKRGF